NVSYRVRQLERAAAAERAAVVDRRSVLQGRAGRGEAAQRDAVRRRLVVHLRGVAHSRGALVADSIGQALAVLVTVTVRNACVVAAAERDGRPTARDAAATAVGEA